MQSTGCVATRCGCVCVIAARCGTNLYAMYAIFVLGLRGANKRAATSSTTSLVTSVTVLPPSTCTKVVPSRYCMPTLLSKIGLVIELNDRQSE